MKFLLSRDSIVLFLITLLLSSPIQANDSAVSTAIGGLVLTREARVSMQKEKLFISEKLVRVEYEFLNTSDADVITEVAFPIPDYKFEWDDPAGDRNFDDFRLWVEGKPVKYEVEIKALLKGSDRASLLTNAGVDIDSFGHFDWNSMSSRDVAKLTPQQQAPLAEAELITGREKTPNWTVRKMYHWSQTFPSGRIVHVVHEYKPVVGWMPVSAKDLDAETRTKHVAEIQSERRDLASFPPPYLRAAKDIDQMCIEPAVQRKIEAAVRARHGSAADFGDNVEMKWVDYILTTANTWQRPIKDFELAVERPKRDKWLVSFCWDSPIDKAGPDRFVARKKDFNPDRELRIGFLRP